MIDNWFVSGENVRSATSSAKAGCRSETSACGIENGHCVAFARWMSRISWKVRLNIIVDAVQP